MVAITLMLAMTLGGTPSPGGRTREAPSEANAWLREWLAPLEAESRALAVGLDRESPDSIGAAIDARSIAEPTKAAMRRAMKLVSEHATEIFARWPSYQDEFTRACQVLASRFPAVATQIETAMRTVRDSEWALLRAEEDLGLLSRGLAELAQPDNDMFDILGDPAQPAIVRSGLRDGFRMSIAATCLVDWADRADRIDPELVRAVARICRDSAAAYTRMIVSAISIGNPGSAARWGLAAHVDAAVIDALAQSRGEPEDPVLGAFADQAEAVDEIVAVAMLSREQAEPRASDA